MHSEYQMAQTFTGTVESVETREFAPFESRYGRTSDLDVQVNLRLIEPSGRLIIVETGAGRWSGKRFTPSNAPWPFLVESGGQAVSTLYIGDRVTIQGTLKGPERVSKSGERRGKPYQVVNRAKVAAVLEHNGQRANGTQIGSLPAPAARPAPVMQATIREVRREERDGMCPHGLYIVRGTDCDECWREQHPDAMLVPVEELAEVVAEEDRANDEADQLAEGMTSGASFWRPQRAL